MKRKVSKIFLVIIAAIMVVYLTCDIFALADARPIKFVASALITLFGLSVINKTESRFVSIGLIFTLAADVFLVLLDKYACGVAVFIAAQLCYTVYLTRLSDKTVWQELLKRMGPAAVVGVAVYAFGLGVNMALPAAYAVCIGVNIAHAAELQVLKPTQKHLRLMVGFIVFVVGDICVGLRHLPIVSENVALVLYIITWLTYPPGQILILSSTGALDMAAKKRKKY